MKSFFRDLINQAVGGILVDSKATVAQLEEAQRLGLLSTNGISGYHIRVGGNVVVPYNYPILIRCITLIAATIAQLVTGGGMVILDKKTGRRVPVKNGTKAMKAMELLYESPDGFMTSYQWVEATASDLLTSSNMVARLERDGANNVVRMHRQAISDLSIEETKDSILYVSRDWNDPIGKQRHLPPFDVVHSLWNSLQMSVNNQADIQSRYMATPVLQLMRNTIQIGLEGDEYIRDFFRGGASQTPFAVTAKKKISDDTRELLKKLFSAAWGRKPIVLGDDMNVIPLNPNPQRKESADLRWQQVEETARVYGLPPPLVGQNVTSWGSGIAELGRFGWRFGIRQHLDRYLSGLERRLLLPGHCFRVNPIDLTRGSPEAIAGAIQLALGSPNSVGYISRQEAREMWGLPEDVKGSIPKPPSQPTSPDKSDKGDKGDKPDDSQETDN